MPSLNSPPRTALRLAAGAAATVALLLPGAAAAQAPDRIDLPAGWQPEGITTDGASLFAGSLADGAIWQGDPATGEGDILVPGEEGSVTVGVDVDPDASRLWAVGGDTGQVRVFDIASGDLLETYSFEAGFLNDVVVTPDAVYATDSFLPQLVVIPLGPDGGLPSPDEATTVPIGGELEYGEGFNLNGIVATETGLVAVHSPTGTLYRLDPATGEATAIDTGGTDLTNGDGMELSGQTLYVVRNQANRIAVLELNDDLSSATVVGELTSDDFDVPTTAALVGDDLWAVNARFGTAVEPDTEFWITRLDTSGDMAEGDMAEDDMGDDDAGGDD